MSTISSQRFHSLDALRASMMLLGLVLHSAVNYMQTPMRMWSIKDMYTHHFFDILFFFIHLFRMPVFFVSAGFFIALLYHKRGIKGMFVNRFFRVGLPFLLSYFTILPLFKMSLAFTLKGGGQEGWAEAMALLSSFAAFNNMHLGHLWFLYYLLFLYPATLVAMPLLKFFWKMFQPSIKQAIAGFFTSWKALLLFSLLTLLTLLPMTEAALDTHTFIIPSPHILLAYGVFFGYGWGLYLQRQKLAWFTSRWKIFSIAALILSTLYLIVFLGKPVADATYAALLGKSLAAVSIWLIIFASIGLFERYFCKPSPMVRYLSDASYWMYLVHLPVSLGMVGVLAKWHLPAFLKFSVVLGVTIVCTLLTYHYLVRSTFIGVFLNGRKYSRTLPQHQPDPLVSSQ